MSDINRLHPYTLATAVIDWTQPEILALAGELSGAHAGDANVARACFEWVRDEVLHTGDHHLDAVTCTASEVLKERTGFCYAKSHLLAALLRANGIPAGFVYQRLALDDEGTTFCLHGLNAVWLASVGWYRLDPRGNRGNLRADFDPPTELLPFGCSAPGEQLSAVVRSEPLPLVIEALRRHRTRVDLEANLPDVTDLDRDAREAAGAVECIAP